MVHYPREKSRARVSERKLFLAPSFSTLLIGKTALSREPFVCHADVFRRIAQLRVEDVKLAISALQQIELRVKQFGEMSDIEVAIEISNELPAEQPRVRKETKETRGNSPTFWDHVLVRTRSEQ